MEYFALSTVSITSLPIELLSNILRFLPARSLANALLVCRVWKDLAEEELSKRKRFISRIFKQESVKTKKTEDIVADIERQILTFLNEIDIVPSAMVISSSGLFHRNAKTLTPLKDFLAEIMAKLPKDCVVIGAQQAGGMIGQTSSGQPIELKGHHKQLSILLIPKAKGVNVNFFKITKTEINKNVDHKDNWRRKFDQLVDKQIKFMFFIGKTALRKCIGDISACTNQVLGEQVVVAGGIAATPFAVVKNKGAVSGLLVGLAIGGNVYAASQVIRDELTFGHEDEGITASIVPRELSFAQLPTACFVVTCVGIQGPFDNNGNLRGFQFKEQCPEFVVFGFFGYGEIGPKSANKPASIFSVHEYSNVYAILALS